MGNVKKVLATKNLKPVEPIFCGIELCETVHIHLGSDFRFDLDLEQFQVCAETLHEALQKWISLGKPPLSQDGFTVLAGKHLPSEPVYNTRFEVEEQVVPSVHIHRRGLSLRFSIPEFLEYVDVLVEAKRNLGV